MSRDGYTNVPNSLLPTGELSARAFGIHVYLLSRPDGWTVRVGDLQKRFKEGRDAIYAALNELVTVGRLELSTVIVATDKGPKPAKRYSLPTGARDPGFQEDASSRHPEKPDTAFPDTAFPDTAFPDALVTTDLVVTTDPLISTDGEARAPEPSTADVLVGDWIASCKTRPLSSTIRDIRRQVEGLLADGDDPEFIAAGLQRWKRKGLSPSMLPRMVQDCMNLAELQEPAQPQRPNRAQQRQAENLAVVARLAELDAADVLALEAR